MKKRGGTTNGKVAIHQSFSRSNRVSPHQMCEDCGQRHAVKITKRRARCTPCDKAKRLAKKRRKHG